MKLLDRYTSTQFLKAVFFGLLAFSMIFILIDMIENLDDFIDENVQFHIIILFYIYFLPRIMSLMVPVAVLLAGLFVTGKLSSNNELTIMKCSGISLQRYMAPFLLIGLVISLCMTVFDGWAVPRINAARLSLERKYLKKSLIAGGRYNMFFQEEGRKVVSMEYFDEGTAAARKVSVQEFDQKEPTHIIGRLDAETMKWDGKRANWILYKGMKRSFSVDAATPITRRETVSHFDSLNLGQLVITPTTILRMQLKPEELELGDFRDYIRREKAAGSDVARLLVDYHGKIAFPFASFIVLFFAIPFASVKRRSGLAVQFGISILLCFVYIVGMKLSQVFGYNGNIHPIIAAWMPNLLFLLAGCYVMIRVPR
jgi:lipopolysaccharide export system permease protein